MLIDKAVETAPQTQQTENGQTESAIKPVSETAPITVDFERLQEENKDIIAWLYCPDTEINYPVVQSKDNEYYLRRLLDGTWNIAGTLFMDVSFWKALTNLIFRIITTLSTVII